MSKSNVIQFKREDKKMHRDDEYLTLLQIVEIGCSGKEYSELKRLVIDPCPGSTEKRQFGFIIYATVVTATEIKTYIYSHDTNTFILEWLSDREEGVKWVHQVDDLDNTIAESYASKGDATMKMALATDYFADEDFLCPS